MKNNFIRLFFFLITIGYSQNYSKVDSLVELYPKNISKIDDLVSKIALDFSSDEEKTRAVFYWVCTTISYDVAYSKRIEEEKLNAYSYKTEKERLQKEKKLMHESAMTAFNSKNAVCYGYASLFKEISNKLGIECELVQGDLKSNFSQINGTIQLNHAWNIVKIKNEWRFIDCTLAAGIISSKTDEFVFKFNDAFFLTDPQLFFLNHYPEDKKWLFVNKSQEEYLKSPLYLPDYIKSNFKIIYPVSGSLSNHENVKLILSNIYSEKDIVKCYFGNSNKFVILDHNQNTNSYEMPLKDVNDDYIIIFVNKTPLLTYKILK
jgi:transglutaminase/protease-like cytokinesis protein 3